MKFFLFTFIVFLPFYVNAQSPYKGFKLENGQLRFDQIYDCDSMSTIQIETMLTTSIPSLKGITDFRKEDRVITCKFHNALIDYRKYGGKWGNTPALLNHPFSGNVTVQWKDHKYRVILTNIVFHTSGFGDMDMELMLTTRKRTMWDHRKGALQIGDYSDKYFTELFIIQPEDNW